jgi:NADH:ubiquinone oxidoreductase subunit 6 (subunit J)
LTDRSKQKERRPFLPVNYRGLLFDLAVFVFNVFLIRLMTHYVGRLLSSSFLSDDPRASRTLLVIISAASAAQLIGAALKRRPLQARLLAQHDGGTSAFGCFMILHFALTLVTSAGIVALLSSETAGGTTVLIFFLSMIPTALVWRAITPYKKPPVPDWRNSHAVEIVADLCLFAYMLVNLAIWSTVTAGSNVRAAGVGDLLSRALGFVLVSPVILLFYIPPRLLFLVEDYKYRATWISMTLAIAPVAYRLIVGSPLKSDW